MSAPSYRKVGTLTAPAALPVLVSVSVAADLTAVALWSSEAGAADLTGGDLGPAASRNTTRPLVALTRHRAGEAEPFSVTAVADLPITFPLVQALSTSDFVVVGARCRWTSDGPEHNAFRIAADGSVLNSGTLGDGIEHVLADESDRLWVGYFDEGVSGAWGWGGSDPPGSAGVVRWLPDGRATAGKPHPDAFELDWRHDQREVFIDDCDALNVFGDQAWACAGGDYEVVRLDSTVTPNAWPTTVAGPRGLLIADDTVALVGEFADLAPLQIARLAELPDATHLELQVPADSGASCEQSRHRQSDRRPTLVSRGSQAHLFAGQDWFVFDLRELI